MKPELVRDLDRPSGWWLLVGGSEQSYVDVADPMHLEFEYVQMAAYLLDTVLPDNHPIVAVHGGGGLLTIPRWLAARNPGSRQVVAEHSPVIARVAASLGEVPGVEVVVADAVDVLSTQPKQAADVVVCDVYDGPETVTTVFTLPVTAMIRDRLRPGGTYVCNLSDATPFALTRTVVATLRAVFGVVVLLAEPPVLRGRRSGNVVLLGSDKRIATAALSRRARAGPTQARVLSGARLDEFVGRARPAHDEADLPASGESGVRKLFR